MFELAFLKLRLNYFKIVNWKKTLYKNPLDLAEVHKFSQVHSLKFQPHMHDCDQEHQSACEY